PRLPVLRKTIAGQRIAAVGWILAVAPAAVLGIRRLPAIGLRRRIDTTPDRWDVELPPLRPQRKSDSRRRKDRGSAAREDGHATSPLTKHIPSCLPSRQRPRGRGSCFSQARICLTLT